MAAVSEGSCLQWLKAKYNVNVRQEWLEACIEFLKQEHGGRFNLQSQLNDLVYEQLLMADFQEMSLGSLPNVSGQLMVTIQGRHTLQMNSILDVGQSAYSHIQKMKGKDDPDSLRENSSNKDTWDKKVKPSRMLYLQLTDGPQSIQAMEYQQIPCLRLDIPPGTKVQIQGPVECRLGVLLLTAKNVHILGGSVDELVETNSLWNMLHNAIGKEPPAPPSGVKIQEPLLEPPAASNNCGSKEPINNVQNTRIPGQNNSYSKTTSANNTRSSNLDSNGRNFTSKQRQPSINIQSEDFEQFEAENDYFDDDGDENFDFDQLDQMEQDVALPEPADDFGKINSPNMEQFDDGCFDDADELMDDDLDPDLEDFDLDTSKYAQNIKTPTAASNKSNIQSKIDIKNPNILLASGTNSHSAQQVKSQSKPEQKSFSNSVQQVKSQSKPEQKSFSMTLGSNVINFNVNTARNTPQRQAEMNKLQQRTMSLASQLNTAVNEQVSAALAAAETAVANATNSINNTVINIDIGKPSINSGRSRAVAITKASNKKKSGSILSHLVPRAMPGEENINTQHKKIKMERNHATSCVDTELPRPYEYLSTVIRNLPYKEGTTIRIKGYIATLISHSQVSDVNQQWRVTVKINDGTASIDADLGEQVLTTLLGCPLVSFQREMVGAKKSRDPLRCRALQQKTVLFQQKLSMISCLMDLHFSTSQPRPVITGLFEASDSDIQTLLQSFN